MDFYKRPLQEIIKYPNFDCKPCLPLQDRCIVSVATPLQTVAKVLNTVKTYLNCCPLHATVMQRSAVALQGVYLYTLYATLQRR